MEPACMGAKNLCSTNTKWGTKVFMRLKLWIIIPLYHRRPRQKIPWWCFPSKTLSKLVKSSGARGPVKFMRWSAIQIQLRYVHARSAASPALHVAKAARSAGAVECKYTGACTGALGGHCIGAAPRRAAPRRCARRLGLMSLLCLHWSWGGGTAPLTAS